jgi:hypothetical protein
MLQLTELAGAIDRTALLGQHVKTLESGNNEPQVFRPIPRRA